MRKKAKRTNSEDLEALQRWLRFHPDTSPNSYLFDTEHLLLAIVTERPNCLASELLLESGLDVEKAQEKLQDLKRLHQIGDYSYWCAWEIGAYPIYRHAARLAGRFQSNSIDTKHLLLMMLHRHRCGAYRFLGLLGINRQRLQNRLVRALQEKSVQELSEEKK